MAAQASGAPNRREWLTIHEACVLVGVAPATLRRWSDAGHIKVFTTPGGHRRFSRAAVIGMLPAARHQRLNLERLGETPERIARVYRREAGEAARATPWLGALDDEERGPFRDHGTQITTSLLGFLDATTPEARETSIASAEVAAAEYGRIAACRGVGLPETVEVFLRFRMPFLRELAAVARRRALDTTEATNLLETATEAIDRLLGALMGGHEDAMTRGCPPTMTSHPASSAPIAEDPK